MVLNQRSLDEPIKVKDGQKLLYGGGGGMGVQHMGQLCFFLNSLGEGSETLFHPISERVTLKHTGTVQSFRLGGRRGVASSILTLSPIVTTALNPTTVPGRGVSPRVPMSTSTYWSPDAVVTVSPDPAAGPLSFSDLRISLPSVAARSATTASPPARPKRRLTKPESERTGSN